MIRHYATVKLSEEFIARVRGQFQDGLLSELGSLDALKKRLSARLAELDTSETNYVRLVGKPGWPEAKIQAELGKIASERDEVEKQLAGATNTLETGRQFYLAGMQLLSDPQAFYRKAGTSLRKAMNKVIFANLYVDHGEISGHELGEAAEPLVQAHAHARMYARRSDGVAGVRDGSPYGNGPLLVEEAGWSDYTETDLLVATLMGHGSSKAVVVEYSWQNSNRICAGQGPVVTVPAVRKRAN